MLQKKYEKPIKEFVWQPRSLEEKQTQDLIKKRFDLYSSIIDEAIVDEETKVQIKKHLFDFWNGGFTMDSIGLCIRGLIGSILLCTDRDSKQVEAKSLFENLRDDLWAFYKEEFN